MTEHFYAVIMAGGGGTRLWPLSRRARPKQMLSLFDERTLFQTSVERLTDLFDCDQIYVVTVEEQARELEGQSVDIPTANFLIEPMPRGTASVIALAALALQKQDPQAVMAVLTSDHFIGNEENFRQALSTACTVAQEGYLVTLGITPSFASTGYGYIQQGEQIGKYSGREVYHVARFKEKPDEEQAEKMLAMGGHAWNSGMFIWRVDQILAEFSRQMPELSAAMEEIGRAWDTPNRQAVIEKIWPAIKSETIDYGIMENAQNVAVIPAADLRWSDVGSWDSLYDVLPADENGNIVMGGMHVGLDTKDCLVYLNEEHRMIVTIGISDLVVVDTGDVLMVCPREQAQRVREIVNQLKKTNQHYI